MIADHTAPPGAHSVWSECPVVGGQVLSRLPVAPCGMEPTTQCTNLVQPITLNLFLRPFLLPRPSTLPLSLTASRNLGARNWQQ